MDFGLTEEQEAFQNTAREFLTESKRIDASAIQRVLDWRPRYPSLAAALADCQVDDVADGLAPRC